MEVCFLSAVPLKTYPQIRGRKVKKYFGSRQRPTEYIGMVSDGLRCEAWHLNRIGDLLSISEITLRADDPLAAWRWLDQFLSSGVRRIPTSDELVCRFGVQTAIYSKAADALLKLFELVKDEPFVAVKFREWNALLAKVGSNWLEWPGRWHCRVRAVADRHHRSNYQWNQSP